MPNADVCLVRGLRGGSKRVRRGEHARTTWRTARGRDSIGQPCSRPRTSRRSTPPAASALDSICSPPICPEKTLKGVDLTRVKLEKADLTGTDLTDAVLREADLSGIDGSQMKLVGRDRPSGELSRGVARQRRSVGRRLHPGCVQLAPTCRSPRGDLCAVFPGQAPGRGRDSKAQVGRRRPGLRRNCTKPSSSKADLHNADLTAASGAEADFSRGANLDNSVATEAKFPGGRFVGARLGQARDGCGPTWRTLNLSGADSVGGRSCPSANLSGARPDGGQPERAPCWPTPTSTGAIARRRRLHGGRPVGDRSAWTSDSPPRSWPKRWWRAACPTTQDAPWLFRGLSVARRGRSRIALVWVNLDGEEQSIGPLGGCRW